MARSTQRDWYSFRRFTSRRPRSQQGTIRRPLERRLWGERLEDRRMLFVTFAGGPWPTTDLTFSYSNMLDGWGSGITNTQITQAVEEAMGIWASVAPLRFAQAGDSGPLPTSADSLYPAASHPLIRWGHHPIDGNPPMGVNVLGHGYQPGTDGRNGDIHFDDGNTFTADGFLELAVHELGHALGLDHPNGDVVAGVCPPAFDAIMHACVGGGGTWDYTALGTAFLLQDDIDGIRSLYDAGLGYVLNATGQLSVFGTAQIDNFSVSYDFGTNMVTVANGINSFTRTMAGVTQIAINGQDGDDTITVSALPTNIVTVVNGGAGNDRLIVRGSENGDTLRLVNGSQASNNNAPILFSNISSVTLSGHGGGDILAIVQAPANLPVTINGGDMDDQIFIADGGSPNAVQSAIVVNGDAGADTLNLAPNAPFTISAITGAITFNGGTEADTLNVGSGNLGAVTGSVTYHGGGQGDKLFLYDGANASLVNYTIGDTSVARDDPPPFGGLNYSYSGVSEITLDATQAPNNINVVAANLLKITVNGNGGDDNFTVGGGNLGTAVAVTTYNIFGGNGSDTLELDDSAYTSGAGWFVESDVVIRFTPLPQFFAYAGFEDVSILTSLGGTNGNSIEVEGSIFVNLSVTGGAGSDAVILTDVSNFQDFDDGGQGGQPPFHYTLDLDGGDGFDTLTVDDTTSVDRTYSIRPDNVMGLEGAPLGLDVDYVGFQDMNFLGGAFIDEYYVFGTPPDIFLGGAGQIEILGNGSQDSLILFPRNAQAQLTINCDITFQGGGAVDTVLVDASGSPFGLHYQMAGGTLTGMGAGSVFVSGNEQLTFNAGNGNDIWTTVLGPLSNPPTTINAGGGSNTFNLDASLTPIAWTINGGPNLDTLNLIDSNNPSPNTSWNINATSVTRTRSDGATVPKVYTHSGVEGINVNGGGSVDLFYVDAVAPGQTLTLNAGASLDGMLLGSQTANNLDSIHGAVVFNGQAGGGNMGVLDAADPTGDTVHLTQTSLGAYPGDNLFGPGGSLTFSDLTNFGGFPGITLNLGTGADTIFAQPLPTALVTINANNPATAPGDKLYLQLELAGAMNPVVSNPSAPNGNVTSSNRQTLNWTGIDQSATVLIPGDFNADGGVGASDLAVWRAAEGVSAAGDGDGDGDTDGADFLVWQRRLGSQSASPASQSNAAATSIEVASRQDGRRRDLLEGPFVVRAVDGSVEEPMSAAARRADARAAAFSRERNRWTASRLGFAESLGNAPWREGLSERRLLAVSGMELEVDRTWRDVNDDEEMSLSDLDFAYAEYGRSLEAVL